MPEKFLVTKVSSRKSEVKLSKLLHPSENPEIIGSILFEDERFLQSYLIGASARAVVVVKWTVGS